MELKLIDVLDSINTLNWVAAQQPGTKESFKLGRLLRPTLREVQAEVTEYQATRKAMLARCGAVAPEGGTGEYTFPNGNEAEYRRENRELLATEIELRVAPVPFSMVEALPWTVGLASNLYWLFEEPAAA